jgi:hypothetical protein
MGQRWLVAAGNAGEQGEENRERQGDTMAHADRGGKTHSTADGGGKWRRRVRVNPNRPHIQAGLGRIGLGCSWAANGPLAKRGNKPWWVASQAGPLAGYPQTDRARPPAKPPPLSPIKSYNEAVDAVFWHKSGL